MVVSLNSSLESNKEERRRVQGTHEQAADHARYPTPHTLHPTPYTPHPTPHTLHPTPYTRGVSGRVQQAGLRVEGLGRGLWQV
jgi:hypothetical protein